MDALMSAATLPVSTSVSSVRFSSGQAEGVRSSLSCRPPSSCTSSRARRGRLTARRSLVAVRAEAVSESEGVATAEPPVAKGEGVREVNINTFYPTLRAAGEKLVVVDLYTQWCGPCKLLAPKIDALVPEYPDVVFVKMDCNQENKSLAKELGIKVVPTFKLFKQNELVGQVAGAKFDALLAEINKLR